MADRNQSHHHFGQPVRPPISTNSSQGFTYPSGYGAGFQGANKITGMPPPSMQGQDFQGPPHSFMNAVHSGQAPQRFTSGPVGPPPSVSGSINGFLPPSSQGVMQPSPDGVSQHAGPQVSASGAPTQPVGTSCPPVSGQYVPASSSHYTAPPSGGGHMINGTASALPMGGFQPPGNQPSHKFHSPALAQGGPQPPVPSLQLPISSSSTITGSSGVTAPPPSGSVSSQSPSVSNASGASTPSSGFPSVASELPVPYHGQAQYSHQIGAALKLSPNPTPNSSEPPSQKSSRGPSPVNEQSYDALEGQFSPAQVPQGGVPPTSGQGMPLPPRPGMSGPPRSNAVPALPGGGPWAAGLHQQEPAHPPVSQFPGSLAPRPGVLAPTGAAAQPSRPAFSQPGAPPVFSGPPAGPPSRLTGPPSRLTGPPSGPPSGLPGPPSSFPGPPGPPSGLPGPPSGPPSSLPGPPSGPPSRFSGPPSSLPEPPSSFTGPPSSLPGPPSGPPSRLPGPPSGLPGPPSSLPGPPSSLPGPPSSLTGPPAGPPSSLPGPPSSLPGFPAGPLSNFPGPPSNFSGPPTRPPSTFPGPPAGPPSSLPGPPTGLTSSLPGPPHFGGPPTGTASGHPGPTSAPPGPPSGPGRPLPGPPSGPFNLGPPSSGQGPTASGSYPQPPLGPQGMVGPPTGPPSGQTGGSSGPVGCPPQPVGPPSGPYGQPPVAPGYPQPPFGQNAVNSMAGDFSRMGVNEMQRVLNLMQEKKLIAPDGVETAQPVLSSHRQANCNPDVFRCTLNAIPQNSSLLNKSRLPLGILIHPFKDLSHLPVIQSSVIVRCRSCRTYINPFVIFVDQRRWKCNLCFRVNELPDEFSFDPVTKTYGDPQRRPEIKSATIEFIAPSEYMLRPPQPAVYLFVLDVSFNAVETGYLRLFTQTLLEELDRLPGDARTQVGFLCFDRALYFFNLSEGLSQPQMMVVPDLEDVFLPTPDNLLVNLHECRDMVVDLLTQLPALFEGNYETGNALGTALQAAFKLMTMTGGRVTVLQTTLPTVGPGALENREATSKASSLNASNLGPASDFYKKLALDCSAQQVAVDLFMLNGQYADIASVSCISKYSAGCVHYYPSFHTARNPAMCDKFESDLRRYLTRKIGFESVMRIRCTRGVSIHTFHGNFFVRSTDLLSLPNINPDAGFGMQMSIEDNLTESSNMCFQAALLYTSSKGERRIRVHTLCVPVTSQLSDVFAGADQQAIAALLAKMAVDRTISSSLEDAREALMNACQDMLNAYAAQIPANQRVGALVAPPTLRLSPLFSLAMLKNLAFRLSPNIKLDDRVYAHLVAKTMPLGHLLQTYYPHLYPVHTLNDEDVIEHNEEKIPKAPQLQLSSANLDRHGVYMMDQGESMYLLVGGAVSDTFCQEVLDVPNFMAIPEGMVDLPELENPTSERLRCFVNHLMDCRPGGVFFLILRDDSKQRHLFFQHMVEDRTESSMSYYEFLQFVQQKVKG